MTFVILIVVVVILEWTLAIVSDPFQWPNKIYDWLQRK